MSRTAWKQAERAIAALLNGRRVPINGRGATADVQHQWLAIECKSWAHLPARVVDALVQAEAAAAGQTRKQLPVAVLHGDHHSHREDLVVMRLSDFVDWFGN